MEYFMDDRVVPGVLAAVGSSPTLEALVTATREEILADLQQI